MKKIFLTFVLLLATTTFWGQSIFDKFDGQDDVNAVIVNKKMFQMMGNVKMDNKDKETQQYLTLIRKLDNLKVFTTTNKKISTDMKLTSDKHIKTVGLEELMRVNDSGKTIKIYVKSGANETQIKELLMYIEGSGKENQTVLMSLTGDFDLDNISVLTEKMRIPGGEVLRKASKK